MNDIDGIKKSGGLRYCIVKYVTPFYSLILMVIKIRGKRILLKRVSGTH